MNEKGAVIDAAVDQVAANDQAQDTDAVADNIKTILNASAQISEASEDQLTELQSSIDTVTGQYIHLPLPGKRESSGHQRRFVP